MTAKQLTDQMQTEVRIQLDTAAIVGGLRSGEITRTPGERFDILVSRMRAHRAAGRMQAAAAAARMAKRLLKEMEG